MLTWLYNILGTMLAWFESWTGTYALSLLFYALIFKVLFIPFSIKQQKNQIAMAKLTPKIELIKAKYRGRTDRVTMQKQQMEIMELQQKEGYSAFSGCLPLLIQLPLIMLLYVVIQNPLSYIAKYDATLIDEQAKIMFTEEHDVYFKDGDFEDYTFEDLSEQDKKHAVIAKAYNIVNPPAEGAEPIDFEYINSKSIQIQLVGMIKNYVSKGDAEANEIKALGINIDSIPNFNLFGVNLAEEPSISNFSVLVLIPLLAAISSWFSMWITRKFNSNPNMGPQDAQARASMRIMDLVMPLMTLFIAFNFSGMLGLYWVFQSVLGVGQSLIIAKVMPLPKYTEEELKAMRKAQKAAEKAQRAAIKSQPKYKSLHYIDEDDYDELPVVKTNTQQKTQKGNMDMPEIKD